MSTAIADAARRLIDALDRGRPTDVPAGESVREAVAAARDLAAAAEAALQESVDRARSASLTWNEIGQLLGTSRQAAFQRFGHPVDPRTGAAMSRAIAPSAATEVAEFLARFTAGQWEDVLAAFDENMRARHDVGRLASGWAHLIGMFGSYEGMGAVSPVAAGDSTVVDVVLQFEAGEAMIWARFDAEGAVTGLRLHTASAETPTAETLAAETLTAGTRRPR